ncbi:unnamed protein product [Cylindrotheca closterium]|uniref:Na+/H+ antiporter NhaC-like C-terminal domain-containing protein n=1 Tax=Cylindrotheca closterium TaxID=2856 RepID=A0AAD2CJY5_9STRA|nr:unnamed protein product [Cylindrotheca closterium]
MLQRLALLSLLGTSAVAAFDYDIVGAGSVVLTDVDTGISDLRTIFTDDEIAVSLDGLEWESNGGNTTDGLLFYKTYLDGELMSEGNMTLGDVGRELPSGLDAGTVKATAGGRHTIEVIVTSGEAEAVTDREVESYAAGVSILPLLVILVLSVTTNMVELSLFSGIFVGACIVAGEINQGFKDTVEDFILNALADVGHGYVFLFTFFLSGLVAMLERSGGMLGFTRYISQYATDARRGQVAAFVVGVVIFFDDYANTLLAGQSMRPLVDSLFVSREKLAFFVDATAAPIASISPVSSWVGYEVGLIQDEIDAISERFGGDITIDGSGMALFLASIKYRYYPIFMLLLIIGLIATQRDFGTMLIAERKTEVYKRTDGGDGGTSGAAGSMGDENAPRQDQPLKTYNFALPIIVLVFLIFYTLVQTGDDGSGEQDFMDKIESSDSYQALLWSTIGTALVTLIFYLVQFTKDGSLIVPSGSDIKDAFFGSSEESDEPKARSILSVRDSLESFIIGMGRVFPACIILTLAWASGSLMKAVGCDRLFAAWIVGGVDPSDLPTLSFLISLFMALATGTSWGTMGILFPLIMVPTYIASNGDEEIFTATVAGVLSGSVAGDHMSPISDTTVLSSLATECGLMEHVGTQAPYVLVVVIISILFGTLPIGKGAWPNFVGVILGILVLVAFIFGICKPVLSPTGAWDPITLLFQKIAKTEGLEKLQKDTIRAASGEDLSKEVEAKKVDVEETPEQSQPIMEKPSAEEAAA